MAMVAADFRHDLPTLAPEKRREEKPAFPDATLP